MVKDRLKRSTLGAAAGQRSISTFFSDCKNPLISPLKNGCKRTKPLHASPAKMFNLDEGRENIPPSPNAFIVPETPDSQIRVSDQTQNPKDESGSPLSHTSCSVNLSARRSLLSRKKPLQQGGPSESPLQPRSKRPRMLLGSAVHRDNELDQCLNMMSNSAVEEELSHISAEKKTVQTNNLEMMKPGDGPVPLHTNRASSTRTKAINFTSCILKSSSHAVQAPVLRESMQGPIKLPSLEKEDLLVEWSSQEQLKHPAPKEGTLGDSQTSQTRSSDASQSQSVGIDDDLMGDDFWLDDIMELNHEEQSDADRNSSKQKAIPEGVILSTGLYNRYWVLKVQEAVDPMGLLEKRLKITASRTLQPIEDCVLRDGWESTPVAVGDVIHLEGECISGVWLINKDSGFLVLLPDLLISSTNIANSIRCMRRAVLTERFKAFEGGSKQMLNGTMVHEIFQKAAMSGDFSQKTLHRLTDLALLCSSHLREMYKLKVTQEDMRQEVEDYLPPLSGWANDYLSASTQSGRKTMILKAAGDVRSIQDAAGSVEVAEFVDIEENIWSPRFGLKGKIDLTARVRIHRRGRPRQECLAPLELKTGRESNSIEHRSQVILYNLMSQERRSDAETGFLLYLKTGRMHPIISSHLDKRELLKLRNTLAHHLANSLQPGEGKESRLAPLPSVISDGQQCKHCSQLRNCALYRRAVENDSGSVAPPPFLEQESGHLQEPHLGYFSHWMLLCALEAGATRSKGGRQNIWLQASRDREVHGGCMGDLLRAGGVTEMADGTYTHRFRRQGTAVPAPSLSVGDWVVVSAEELRLFALAKGYVMEVSCTGVSCHLDRNLSNMSPNTKFRLDQDEGESSFCTHLGNLSKMMENTPISERLRDLVVDFRPPRFIPALSSVLPREAKDTVANILKGLNKPQKQAMKKVLLSKDYTLIVGMPGTGKTTTICTLVRILHACGFSVLLTSYTHSAVDTILLKLKRFKVGFLRLGRTQKVHPDIRPFTEESCSAGRVQTLPELEQLYNSELVVATTCMGVTHPIFSRRRFDFCIVDEASQISQPICLGPLFYAERFVLVGDHQQLSPIVHSREARALGMDESLFKRLECHRDAVVQLNVQYRMNSKIMSLSNMLMYGGKLECGSERTATAVLQLPNREVMERELQLCFSQPEYLTWIQTALDPEIPVCFLDTAKVPSPETIIKGGISNPTEAILVHSLVRLLLKAGCPASDIGVIAPYRQQLSAISALLVEPAYSAVEVNTVDKYQGRDKSVIIVSFVRSHSEGKMGELLKDWRRLNVAITRAKHKLLLLGCSSTLCHYEPLQRLLTHLDQESLIVHLPPAAQEALPTFHL